MLCRKFRIQFSTVALRGAVSAKNYETNCARFAGPILPSMYDAVLNETITHNEFYLLLLFEEEPDLATKDDREIHCRCRMK